MLSGKAQYRLNVVDTLELEAGRPADTRVVTKYAKNLGMFKKVGARYYFGDRSFATQRDFQAALRVDPDYDAWVKWLVIQEAKRLHIERIGTSRVKRVKTCTENATSVAVPKTTARKKRKVILKKRSTSAA